MGYVGPGLEFGAFQKIDDISSGFNGSATQFNVQIGGTTAEIASLNPVSYTHLTLPTKRIV